MSTWAPQSIPCPRCGAVWEVPVLKGIHLSRLPAVRQQLLAGEFQRHACPACGNVVQLEQRNVATDFPNRFYVGVELPDTRDWRAAKADHQRRFDEVFALGPPIAEEMGQSLTTRLVFGVAALREKFLLWDAGLDDRVVEAMKIERLAAEGLGPEAEVWRAVAVLDGGHVLCDRLSPIALRDGPPPEGPSSVASPRVLRHVLLLQADYLRRQMHARRIPDDHPSLSDAWLVDAHRAALP